MEITEVKIRKIMPDGYVKAIASIVVDGVFAIHDMKVIKKKEDGKFFVAMPYRHNGDGRQIDIAHPINGETRKYIEDIIISAYFNALEDRIIATDNNE